MLGKSVLKTIVSFSMHLKSNGTKRKNFRSTIGPKYQLINLDRRFLVRSDRQVNIIEIKKKIVT